MIHPHIQKSCVRYYYLVARYGNCAEIIKVLNSQDNTINVPVWEEDVTLEPFHIRFTTADEENDCKETETWEIFQSWNELYAEEHKQGVEDQELRILEHFRNKLALQKSMVA